MSSPIPIRPRDISGLSFPPVDYGPTGASSVVLQVRPPWFEPPDGAKEFNVSYSLNAAGGGVATALFTLDANNNVTAGAAIRLPTGTQARINNVSVGGDTGAVTGTPQLVFSIRTSPDGQQFLPGWEALGLPGRGGVVTVAFEPFTRVTNAGSFFGGFVVNNSGGPLYAEMILTGWYW
jgi:hypothetical protein